MPYGCKQVLVLWVYEVERHAVDGLLVVLLVAAGTATRQATVLSTDKASRDPIRCAHNAVWLPAGNASNCFHAHNLFVCTPTAGVYNTANFASRTGIKW